MLLCSFVKTVPLTAQTAFKNCCFWLQIQWICQFSQANRFTKHGRILNLTTRHFGRLNWDKQYTCVTSVSQSMLIFSGSKRTCSLMCYSLSVCLSIITLCSLVLYSGWSWEWAVACWIWGHWCFLHKPLMRKCTVEGCLVWGRDSWAPSLSW